MSQAGHHATATDGHRNGVVSGSDGHAPTATAEELAAAAARQRARHLGLMLMAASAVAVVGGIALLLWRLT